MAKLDAVVIIGRINVGKSTLFNRLTEKEKAIVSKTPGTTRDRNFGQVLWRGKIFNIIDSGGVNIDTLKNSIGQLISTKKIKFKDSIEQGIIKQTKQALREAKLVLFLVDGKQGLLPQDKELALVLKKLGKHVILVCNKIDSKKYLDKVNEFYKLGLGDPRPVSATTGLGTGDLLDEIVKRLKIKAKKLKEVEKKDLTKVAIIGKPNVGKSSLMNKLSRQERVIVSPIPQTTREPQDIVISYKKNPILFIDTAGLRKLAKIKPGSIEKTASQKVVTTIKNADIVLFVVDVSLSFERQDKFLAGLIMDSESSIIVVLNKWDKISQKDQKKYLQYFDRTFSFMAWVPKIFVSAKTGLNVKKIFELILQAANARQIEVSENALDKFLKKLIKKHKPQAATGRTKPYLHSLKQTDVNPPQFTLLVAKGVGLKDNYIKFLAKQIREKFDFFACPIKIKVGQKK